MYSRHLLTPLEHAMSDTPVILVHGARQTGKSTLATQVVKTRPGMASVTLDDLVALAAARRDPAGFIAGYPTGLFLDEIQRALDVVLPIKLAVDRDRRAGHFLVTGSANVMLLPALADSLAGRMQVLTLWPLSQGEIEGVREGFVDHVFAAEALPPIAAQETPRSMDQRMLRGGYPEAVLRTDAARRAEWFNAYASALVQRDILELARIDAVHDLDRLLRLLASRTGELVNLSEYARTLGIAQTTLKRYLALLEAAHIVKRIGPWSGNATMRMVRSPKLLFCDSGLAAALSGSDEASLASDPGRRGHLLESFVVAELLKQLGWSRTRARLFHFRTGSGEEVDVVLEGPGGRLVGVEIKSSHTVQSRDARGLEALRRAAPHRFHRGVVLHMGDGVIPFGDRIWAVPVEALWRWPAA